MSITYTELLTVDSYNDLRKSVNWSTIGESLERKGLEHTALMMSANDEGIPVVVVRVIIDYGYIVYITDVVVHPDYQGKDIGRELMSKVIVYIAENSVPGQRKYINIMSASDKENFYEKFGFIKRQNDTLGCGLTQWVQKETLAGISRCKLYKSFILNEILSDEYRAEKAILDEKLKQSRIKQDC